MVILMDSNLREIGVLEFQKIDFDVAGDMDFEITISREEYKESVNIGGIVAIENTEYGGIIGEKISDSSTGTVILRGKTFRGVLNSHILIPDTAQNLRVYGSLGKEIDKLLKKCSINSHFISDMSNNLQVSVILDRYCSILKALEDVAKATTTRFEVVYVRGKEGEQGSIEINFLQINDYSKEIELSEDSRLDFKVATSKNGVNHLICLGKGELDNRDVIHLYVDGRGQISERQYYFGIDEITQVYDYNNAEHDELRKSGEEKLKELQSKDTLDLNVGRLELDREVGIGDVIGGKDHITGAFVKKPIINKIYTEENGMKRIDYKLEGES